MGLWQLCCIVFVQRKSETVEETKERFASSLDDVGAGIHTIIVMLVEQVVPTNHTYNHTHPLGMDTCGHVKTLCQISS